MLYSSLVFWRLCSILWYIMFHFTLFLHLKAPLHRQFKAALCLLKSQCEDAMLNQRLNYACSAPPQPLVLTYTFVIAV